MPRSSSPPRAARRRRRGLAGAAGLLALLALGSSGQAAPTAELWRDFVSPPDDARPMMRWWWFGPAVTSEEIDRELAAMKAGGIGGVEVQAVYPMQPDGGGLVNTPYLSDGFLKALRHAAQRARAEGLRIDVTLGSGWPYGGPHVPIDQASAEVRMQRKTIAAGATRLVLPAPGSGESILDVRVGDPAAIGEVDRWARVTPSGGVVALAPSPAPREALVFVAGRTGQQVKRAAVGAEGYVIDHLDPAAVRNHLASVGEKLLSAFDGLPPPDAVFSDSLEAYGASWTGDFAAEFQRRRGYDLLEHLPALFLAGEGHDRIRYDWARTLSELVDERYVAPIDGWARAHGTRFRGQIYGFPAPTLSSNALLALPEGEGQDWRGFTSTRWATSAAHLYGKPVVSSEVWTWLHSPAWAATPLDMKMEADRHFLQGVNQLVGHGWPYSPPQAGAPGWTFYAAAALNDHNPWYGAMPEVSRYLQRVSHLLREGQPANGVAIYLPIEDAFAAMTPDRTSANEAMADHLPAGLVARVLDAGYGFDFIDAEAVDAGKLFHQILVLPPMNRIDAKALAAIETWTGRGGRVIAIDHLPTTSGGRLEDSDRAAVARITERLATNPAVSVTPADKLGAALAKAGIADVALAAPEPDLGFIRRRLPDEDVFFLANTGNRPIRAQARFKSAHRFAEWWDPLTGARVPAADGGAIVALDPYESRFLVFGDTPPAAKSASSPSAAPRSLAKGWTLSMPGRPARLLSAFASWTDDPESAGVSGVGVYRTRLRLAPIPAGRCYVLDFGEGRPTAPPKDARPQAALAAPVRDAAVVTVNGQRVGSVWAPPYRIALGSAAKAGDNTLEIAVGNTNQNMLVDRPPPDFRLLAARYGERFKPQDQERLAAQPSGLLRAPTLDTAPCP